MDQVLPVATGASSDPQGATGMAVIRPATPFLPELQDAPDRPDLGDAAAVTTVAPVASVQEPVSAPAAAPQAAPPAASLPTPTAAPAAPTASPAALDPVEASLNKAALAAVPVDKMAAARAALIAAGLPTDVVDGIPPVPAGPGIVSRATNATVAVVKAPFRFTAWLNGAVTGIRALLFFGVTGGIGLLDSLNGIDLSSLLETYLGGTKVKPGDIMVLMAVAGALLRLITRTPVFVRWRSAAHAGGASDSKVDEPLAGL